MKKYISIEKAVNKGRWLMVFIPLIVFLSTCMLVLFVNQISAILMILFASFLLSWLSWSYNAPRWRIWALENVKDVHKLMDRAIEAQLIWPEDSLFNRTEIRTKAQKLKLQQLMKKFQEDIDYQDNISVPNEMNIYFIKRNIYFMIFIILTFNGVGIYLFCADKGYLYIVLALIMSFFIIKEDGKSLFNKEVQLVLNDKFILIAKFNEKFYWNKIVNEEICFKNNSKYLVFNYKNNANNNAQYFEIEVGQLEDFENLLEVYRFRYETNLKIK
jgi:hypothetical protein